MPEPTTTVAGAIAAGASAISLALLGVDYYSLIWGMVGALLALYQAAKMGRVRSVIFVSLSTLVGAACGTGALSTFQSESRPLLIVCSLVAGFGAQLIVTALLRAGINRIDKLGGVTGIDKQGEQ
ncbi:hypothetical protein [Variovorax sp. 3P27G3]|uniref:hypothetical protein n=1 Tax=Variovorax sp. 3P27G3 TaxID=2502214 RepID=UPI0010F7BEA1|nr:hypothetical protein [Variovorax sp. 3P27G3]